VNQCKVHREGFRLLLSRTCQGCGKEVAITSATACLNCNRVFCPICSKKEIVNLLCKECIKEAQRLGLI